MAKKDAEGVEVPDVIEPEMPHNPAFVLIKNHGLILHGRESQYFPAGTEFDPIADAKLIAALAKSGAQLEER